MINHSCKCHVLDIWITTAFGFQMDLPSDVSKSSCVLYRLVVCDTQSILCVDMYSVFLCTMALCSDYMLL